MGKRRRGRGLAYREQEAVVRSAYAASPAVGELIEAKVNNGQLIQGAPPSGWEAMMGGDRFEFYRLGPGFGYPCMGVDDDVDDELEPCESGATEVLRLGEASLELCSACISAAFDGNLVVINPFGGAPVLMRLWLTEGAFERD